MQPHAGCCKASAFKLENLGNRARRPFPPLIDLAALVTGSSLRRTIMGLSVGMAALAVSYYFLVSLPASNRERLQVERDAAASAKGERDTKEQAALQAAQDRDLSLQTCIRDADTTYWSYVKLNGKEIPGKAGTYSAPAFVWDTADKRKGDALAECHRQYDPKK